MRCSLNRVFLSYKLATLWLNIYLVVPGKMRAHRQNTCNLCASFKPGTFSPVNVCFWFTITAFKCKVNWPIIVAMNVGMAFNCCGLLQIPYGGSLKVLCNTTSYIFYYSVVYMITHKYIQIIQANRSNNQPWLYLQICMRHLL